MRNTAEDLKNWKYQLLSLPVTKIEDSSQIQGIAYHENLRVLVVHFTYSRAIYAYANVMPDFHMQFTHAPSKGQFLSQRIKAHPDIFPYLRLQ